MIMQNEHLAFRYATAFLNVFGDQMTMADASSVYVVHTLLMKYHDYQFFLSLSTVPVEKKKELIDVWFGKTTILNPIQRLLELLIKQKRIILFEPCLKYIWRLYQQRAGVLFFSIKSSHALAEKGLQVVEHFLQTLSGKKIMYEYIYDPMLIAGMRLQADEYFWEYSVAQKLREIRQTLYR